MLLGVGMLNYMGNSEIPNICATNFDEQYNEESAPHEEFRVSGIAEAKNELMLATLGSATEDLNSDVDWSLDKFFDPSFVEYGFNGDLVPAKPDQFANGKV